MKRVFLAALLASTVLALARADEGAYRSLIGMSWAAKTDRGPNADLPAGCASAQKKTNPADAAALRDLVAEKSTARPRSWTRFYATLLPTWRRRPILQSEFEPAISSITLRAFRPLRSVVPADAESVQAGEWRGLAELLSASAMSTDGQ